MNNYFNCTKEVREILKQIINDKFPEESYYKAKSSETLGGFRIPDNIIYEGTYYDCLDSYSKIYQKFTMRDGKFDHKNDTYLDIELCDLITLYYRDYCNYSYLKGNNQKIAEVMAKHIIEDDLLIKVDI